MAQQPLKWGSPACDETSGGVSPRAQKGLSLTYTHGFLISPGNSAKAKTYPFRSCFSNWARRFALQAGLMEILR